MDVENGERDRATPPERRCRTSPPGLLPTAGEQCMYAWKAHREQEMLFSGKGEIEIYRGDTGNGV